MQINTPLQRQKRSGLPRLLLFCILISFLIHILFIWLVPEMAHKQTSSPIEPTFVTLEELPAKSKTEPKEMELDETPLPDEKRPVEASRVAESDQSVEKEMAPKGEDSRDIPANLPSPKTESEQMTQAQSTQQTPEKKLQTESSADQTPQESRVLPSDSKPAEERLTEKKRPPLNLGLSPQTFERMARNERREQRKKRDDVMEGDAVYLNLQHDFLISFFKRFSNRIESSWSYPAEAAKRSEQGTLLLKITVTREGKLVDVELMESSGSDDLDYEAIQAVYRAAPFGPITKHWKHEQMKIYAHFQYTLSNRYIFGN